MSHEFSPRRTGEATVADNVRFHDDKSTFTGVHTSGKSQRADGSVDAKHVANFAFLRILRF